MKKEIEAYALVIHGVMLTLHALAIFHNVRRKNWGDTTFHTIAVAYETYATHVHARNLSKEE